MGSFARIQSWLAPPEFENDEERSNAAVVLNAMLLMVSVAVLVFLVSNLFFGPGVAPLVTIVALAMLVTCATSFVLMRRGHVRLAGAIVALVFWVGFTLAAAVFQGVHDPSVLGYFVVIVVAGIVLGQTGLVAFTMLSMVSVVALFVAENMGAITPEIPLPTIFSDLVLTLLAISTTALLWRYAVRRLAGLYAAARQSAVTLRNSNVELEASRDALARQRFELERRTRYLEVTAAVARDTTLELDIRELLPRLTHMVTTQLGFYHTGIFLLQPGAEWLVLQAASSEGGQRMLARGHRLRVGEGIVGYVAQQRRYYVMMDVGRDGGADGPNLDVMRESSSASQAVYFDNPDLPETRSEAALPLIARRELIGVLDVQSTELSAFGEQDVVALQVLANQLALAIRNARLYHEAQQALEAQRAAYGDLSQQAWRELLRAQPDLSVARDGGGLAPVVSDPDDEVQKALCTGQAVVGGEGGDGVKAAGLAVPIRVRGRVIGAIDAHKPPGGGEWTREQIALLETLGEQVGDALEDARLYRDAQQRAVRERTLSEVAGRVRESLDLDAVLQRAVQEMREALGVAEVEVRVDTSPMLAGGLVSSHSGEAGDGHEAE